MSPGSFKVARGISLLSGDRLSATTGETKTVGDCRVILRSLLLLLLLLPPFFKTNFDFMCMCVRRALPSSSSSSSSSSS